MVKTDRQSPYQLPLLADDKAVRYLKQALIDGKNWYIALLEAIELWDILEETHNGLTFRYLIDGEAFDWILLAERLCQAVDGLLPDDEKMALLFHSQPPLNLPADRFKEIVGSAKYHQYLNYYYGITVEEALILAVQEEVRKEMWVSGYRKEKDVTNEAYRRIYGATKGILLRQFRRERRYPQLKSIILTELKEFTYWLFKYRLKHCEKTKVASDTKKALDWLKRNGFSKRLDNHEFNTEFMEILPADSSDSKPGQD